MARKRTERPQNERLMMAFKYAGYDPMEMNFSRSVAKDMIFGNKERHVSPVIYFQAVSDKEKELNNKISSLTRTLNKHLQYEDCTHIEGNWIVNYCNFFGCSADFLYGLIDTPRHEQTDITKYTGLSANSVTRLHRIHTYKWKTDSSEYTEPHKMIDFLNELFDRKQESVLYDCYEYVHARNIVMPKVVTLTDDTGTGHLFPADKLYRQAKLADVVADLDSIAKR